MYQTKVQKVQNAPKPSPPIKAGPKPDIKHRQLWRIPIEPQYPVRDPTPKGPFYD